jgi:hypothetical protein
MLKEVHIIIIDKWFYQLSAVGLGVTSNGDALRKRKKGGFVLWWQIIGRNNSSRSRNSRNSRTWVAVVSANMNETEFRKMNSRINPEEELI